MIDRFTGWSSSIVPSRPQHGTCALSRYTKNGRPSLQYNHHTSTRYEGAISFPARWRNNKEPFWHKPRKFQNAEDVLTDELQEVATHPNWSRCVPRTGWSQSSTGIDGNPPICQVSVAGCSTVRPLSCPPSWCPTTIRCALTPNRIGTTEIAR